jgi:hypothetical protein
MHHRVCFIFIFLFSSIIFAEKYDYIYPYRDHSFSNYGTIGLLQNPNARFFLNGSMGFTWTHNDPYLRGSLVAYPFNWMEVSYQYTDINNALYSPFSSFSGSQSLKDKSFDAKFRILKESDYLPQIAFGFRDLAGTGLFSSEYIVASKFLSQDIDFTLGIGWGVLSGQSINNPFTNISDKFLYRDSVTGAGGKFNIDNYYSGSAGYFAGVEYFIPKMKGMSLKLEYDGTNYDREGVKPIKQKESFNIGFTYPVSENFSYKFSFIRGNTLSFGFSYKLNLGDKNAQSGKKNKQVLIKNNNAIKIVTSKSEENLYKATLKYLRDENFFLQKASINEEELSIIYAQSNFRNATISAGRALNILDQISPEKITRFNISEVNGGIGLYSLEIDRASHQREKAFNVPPKISESISAKPFIFDDDKYYAYNPIAKYPAFFNSIGPDLRTQIGGPDGFFFGDLKLAWNSELLFNKNLSLISRVHYGIYDNMGKLKLPSDSILPHVRTDIVQYLKNRQHLSIERLQLNKFGQFSPSIFYKLSGGIFESMFSGYGGEILYKPFSENYALGLEVWKVFQRDYDQLFKLRDYSTTTGHLSFYYTEPRTNVTFRLKGGRFLAEDSGVSFDFWRVFYSGFRLGAFFTLTDISAEEFGEGSFDKGFYFHIPLEIFSKTHSKRNFGWGLRPLTRDGGASLIQSHPLWGVTDQSHINNFNRHLVDFYD